MHHVHSRHLPAHVSRHIQVLSRLLADLLFSELHHIVVFRPEIPFGFLCLEDFLFLSDPMLWKEHSEHHQLNVRAQ